ncbi:PAS domain-containing protein [Jannaschia ovalis]|uniref:PAS domain-containing protein n=1 Tax=Jannaschia ovalis TaxID=3038773 RepID=A0ABY8LGR6_9RHOB|nr:PAS domain-containing protein [Jannaschia sp. GRR-S6-38]WGH79325.1 PAS domain-containing protein [Jannaschia sp. GRR-S6-38]
MDEGGALDGFSRVRVAVVLTDARAEDNPIVYVNSAFEQMTGYSRSAVVGRNCRFLQGEKTDKADVDRLRSALSEGRDVTLDILNYRADGEPFTNRVIIAPICDAESNPIYFLGIQKEVYASEKEESGPGSDILMALRGRVQEDLSLLLQQVSEVGEDRAPSAFEEMNRRIECLQLAYESVRLSDRQGALHPGIDLGALVSRAAAAVAHHEGRPGVRYVQSIDPMDVNLDAAVRVTLLMSEVLANAFHHAFDRMDDGFVELRLKRLAAGGLRLSVSDDGLGLPANAPFPDPNTVGGRLVNTLVGGLDATLTPVRGAAGTVVMIDVPVDMLEI